MTGWEFWVPVSALLALFYVFMTALVCGVIDAVAGRKRGDWRDPTGDWTTSHWGVVWPVVLPGLVLVAFYLRVGRPLINGGERVGELVGRRS